MMSGIFITGTDTGVGKTVITCALLRVLHNAGRSAVAMKPVAAGAQSTPEGLRNADALKLMACSNPQLSYAQTNPCVYADPTSPNIAARLSGESVGLKIISTAYSACRAVAETVLVEGIGGWRVPLGDSLQTVDLVRHLEIPVLLVCGLRLGCINHALLSAAAIVADGVTLLGWVANAVDPIYRYETETIETLKARMPAPLLGVTAWHDPPDPAVMAPALEAGGRHLWH